MSSNALTMAVASSAVVVTADVLANKGVTAPQIVGAVMYIFALSLLNGWNSDFAGKLSLLVFVGVLLTKGFDVLKEVNKAV